MNSFHNDTVLRLARSHGPIQAPKRARYLLITFALSLAAICALQYFQIIFNGNISYWDEFLSLDRTHSLGLFGDFFAVYTKNIPNFNKPPLQYWLNYLFYVNGLDLVSSIRIVSFIFAVMALFAMVMLANVAVSGSLLPVLAASLFFASSEGYWTYATTAMLESGTVFFCIMCVLCAFLALERPRLWYVWAIFGFLGAMQKSPAPVALSALIILTHFLMRKDDRNRAFGPDFKNAARILLALLCIWPIILVIRYGTEPLEYGIRQQMIERFSPFALNRRNNYEWLEFIMQENYLVWAVGVLGALYFLYKRTPFKLFQLSAIIAVFLIGMLTAGGVMHDRYLLLIWPFVCITAAMFIREFAGRRALYIPICAALLLFDWPLLHAEDRISKPDVNQRRFAGFYEEMNQLVGPDDNLMLCGRQQLQKPLEATVSVYASKGRPIYNIIEVQKNDLEPPYNQGTIYGLCQDLYGPDLAKWMIGYSVIRHEDGYVLWKADGIKRQ